jgi:hypothetical protein
MKRRGLLPLPPSSCPRKVLPDMSDDVNVASIAEPTPYVLEYIRDYWGPSKAEMSFKCRSKHCNKEIKYSSTSFANLKTHYKNLHPAEHADFLAALSASYAYKKRGRNSSGAR